MWETHEYILPDQSMQSYGDPERECCKCSVGLVICFWDPINATLWKRTECCGEPPGSSWLMIILLTVANLFLTHLVNRYVMLFVDYDSHVWSQAMAVYCYEAIIIRWWEWYKLIGHTSQALTTCTSYGSNTWSTTRLMKTNQKDLIQELYQSQSAFGQLGWGCSMYSLWACYTV